MKPLLLLVGRHQRLYEPQPIKSWLELILLYRWWRSGCAVPCRFSPRKKNKNPEFYNKPNFYPTLSSINHFFIFIFIFILIPVLKFQLDGRYSPMSRIKSVLCSLNVAATASIAKSTAKFDFLTLKLSLEPLIAWTHFLPWFLNFWSDLIV